MTNSPTPRRHLSMIVDDSPCDGSHGRFCPECASINRWKDREATTPTLTKKPLYDSAFVTHLKGGPDHPEGTSMATCPTCTTNTREN